MTKFFLQMVQVLFSEPEADLFIHRKKAPTKQVCAKASRSVSGAQEELCTEKGVLYLGWMGGRLLQKWAVLRLFSFPHDLHGLLFSPKSHEQAKRCRTVKSGTLSLAGTP